MRKYTKIFRVVGITPEKRDTFAHNIRLALNNYAMVAL